MRKHLPLLTSIAVGLVLGMYLSHQFGGPRVALVFGALLVLAVAAGVALRAKGPR